MGDVLSDAALGSGLRGSRVPGQRADKPLDISSNCLPRDEPVVAARGGGAASRGYFGGVEIVVSTFASPAPMLPPELALPPPRPVRRRKGTGWELWFSRVFLLPHTLVGLA